MFLVPFQFLFILCLLLPQQTTSQTPPGLTIIGQNVFQIPNPYRPNSSFKFSISGIKIINTTYTRLPESWNLELENFPEDKIYIYRYYSERQKKTGYKLRWVMHDEPNSLPDRLLEVCFHYGHNNASWFNTYEELNQSWPMAASQLIQKPIPFTTGQPPFGSLIEYLFLNSDGFALMLSDIEPLQLRFSSEESDPRLCVSIDKRYKFTLQFNILASSNLKTVYDEVTSGTTAVYFRKLNGIPDEQIFREAIWSTKAQYRRTVNQTNVLELARQIKSHGFTCSQIIIDDKWEGEYGDLTFDRRKFPDPRAMIAEIHKLGCRVSVAVHPFVSTNSAVYNSSKLHLAKDKNGVFVQTKWWNGPESTSGMIDISTKQTSEWFIDRLVKLKRQTGLDTFKFDAGERHWYSLQVHFTEPAVRIDPNLIVQKWTLLAARLGSAVEVGVGFKSQFIPLFVRLPEQRSTWDGLKSLIPTALTVSIAGYPFILSDMIGGDGDQLTEELYIRWVQASTFLPAMKFSIVPWKFNESTVQIVKTFINLHGQHAATIVALARRRVSHGELLLRPLWYAEPNDPKSWAISDQFMVGENLLVAPVVVEGGREREVYLPTGTWIDQHGKSYKGPGVVKVKAPLEELPYFKRSEK